MAVTESFIKRIRMCEYKHTHTVYTHTHALVPLSIMFAQGTPTGPPPTPHPPSLLLLLPPPSRVLPSFLFSILCFFLSVYLPRLSLARWTCCRSDMQQHARVTAVSVPVHPFILSRSFCVHPSIHHPSTLLVISIDLAGAMTMRVCSPPPAIIRQALIHQRRPLCACVSHDRLYICFCAPGQLCLGLDRACRILNAICALLFHFIRVYTNVPLICAIISRYSTRWACDYLKQRSCGCTHTCTHAASRWGAWL